MGQAKQRGSLSDRIAQAQKQDIGSVSMTDPTDTLTGFQQAFLDGLLRPKRCDLDRDLFVVQDEPAGVHRLTYVRFDKLRVTALGVFVAVEPIKGVACFQLGYAVPPEYRGHGYASDLVLSALAEMHNGLGRNGVEKFCIEAVVGEENAVSRRVAEKIGFGTPKEIIDELSGKSALQYVLQVPMSIHCLYQFYLSMRSIACPDIQHCSTDTRSTMQAEGQERTRVRCLALHRLYPRGKWHTVRVADTTMSRSGLAIGKISGVEPLHLFDAINRNDGTAGASISYQTDVCN